MTISLRGLTWNHTRGYLPMIATGQRFSELHPEVEIVWEKCPQEELAALARDLSDQKLDFLNMDAIGIGEAAQAGLLVPLDAHLPREFMDDQARHSVGGSHESFQWGGHQWALAIDTSAVVSARRSVLLEQCGLAVPNTWDELIALARRGWVAVPGSPHACLLNFYLLCASLGEEPFQQAGTLVSDSIGGDALNRLRELMSHCPEVCYSWGSAATLEAMACHDNIGYCPFVQGYVNYARSGYASYRLHFGELVSLDGERPLRSVLEAKGLSITSRCLHLKEACEYAQFVASPSSQRGFYFESGGQPAHRKAWLEKTNNMISLDFFQKTLPVIERAFVPPRFGGYHDFRRQAGLMIQEYLGNGGDPTPVLDRLKDLHKQFQAT
ncbi:MAG: carbohydrate ABC transporter substrate-binding protein [Terriglobia bacterium]